MTHEPVKTAVVGCGLISHIYLEANSKFEILDIVAVADLIRERAEAKAAENCIPRVATVEEVLADEDIEIVVNLTVPKAHGEVNLAALAAGKSAYTEKPFCIDRADGQRCLALAAEKGVRIGGAPDTFLGGGIQTCTS